MKPNNSLSILLLVSCLLVLSCQKDAAPQRQDPLAKGYQHIDRGNYDAAIEELTALSKRDSRPEVLVTLASAYAARAGIKVSQYWGFVIGFKAPLVRSESLPVNDTVQSLRKIARESEGKLDLDDVEAFGGILKAVGMWELYKDRIEAIPVVRGVQEQDVATAVQILDRVRTPGSRLYRAILNLILFKSAINLESADPKISWKGLDKVVAKALRGDTQSLCGFDFVKFSNWLQPMSVHLGETLSDLMIAYPEQHPTLLPAYEEVQKVDDGLIKASSELRIKKGCA